jgi:C4-dicarboxylate-specific signal transduction histidine kinase
VAGYAQLLAMRPELAGGPGAEWAREAAREADRCGEILRRLSTFARRGAAESPARAPLAAVVQDVLALKAYDLRAAGVSVETAIEEGVEPAMDRSVLQHVLLNLVNNAIAALRTAPRRALRLASVETPAGLELRVSDSGPGVPAPLRERIFDPFFTTRPAEEATGLGLSTCRELLGKAGGTIELERPPVDDAGGATFVLRLPSAVGATAIAAEPAAA